MNVNFENHNLIDQDPYYGSNRRIRWLVIRFTISGIVVSATWLTIFVAGLLVDSSYYRTAISFHFAGLKDWIVAIITFTFSNVILLAFMSGLLGGITSKMLYTKCFRISRKDYEDANTFQIENPFISAFRGMFVFIAILFMQYVSSFSDLGAINRIPDEERKANEVRMEKMYNSIAEEGIDIVSLKKVRSELDKIVITNENKEPDTSVINTITYLNADLRELKKKSHLDGSEKKRKIELEIKVNSLRRTLKIPSNSDFSGIGLSSISYFKFAVIVSFLAFTCGYDPSLFKVLLDKILKLPGKKDPAENHPVQ